MVTIEQYDIYWVDLDPTRGGEMTHCSIAGREGEIATDQIRTVEKVRLKRKMGSLTPNEVNKLWEVLRQMFCE